MELYGLIAVLVVLIPEWLADGTLALNERPNRSAMPMTSRAWRTLPELQLASMTLCELRLLARDLMPLRLCIYVFSLFPVAFAINSAASVVSLEIV